jgi:hypothetical protein
MGKYEVRQGEYLAVMRNNPSYFTGDDYPESRNFRVGFRAVLAPGQP